MFPPARSFAQRLQSAHTMSLCLFNGFFETSGKMPNNAEARVIQEFIYLFEKALKIPGEEKYKQFFIDCLGEDEYIESLRLILEYLKKYEGTCSELSESDPYPPFCFEPIGKMGEVREVHSKIAQHMLDKHTHLPTHLYERTERCF